jgi:hypothetical protein
LKHHDGRLAKHQGRRPLRVAGLCLQSMAIKVKDH